MKMTLCLSMTLSVLLISGCFGSHSSDDQNDDQADDGNRAEDGSAEKSDSEKSVKKDIEDVFELSPEEGAELAADLFCSYADNCGMQSISCEVSTSLSTAGSGSSSQETGEEVHCEVGSRRDAFLDDCQGEVTVTVQRGLECADPTPQQERDFKNCLLALVDWECVEITDEMLREYEAAIASGDDSAAIGSMPEACLRLEDIFDCADGEPSSVSPAMRCEPGQYAQCTCSDGQKGIQSCLPDRTFSPCDCWQDVSPIANVAGMAGAVAGAGGFASSAPTAGAGAAGGFIAGAGGSTSPPQICVVDEILECICSDGSVGTQICIDGWSFSECECHPNE